MEIIGLGDDCRLPAADCIRLVRVSCGASYDYGDRDFLDFSTRGRQAVCLDYMFLRAGVCAADAG